MKPENLKANFWKLFPVLQELLQHNPEILGGAATASFGGKMVKLAAN